MLRDIRRIARKPMITTLYSSGLQIRSTWWMTGLSVQKNGMIKKEKGLVEGQPVSFHYWAVDDGRFIGEFQLRTEFPAKVMLDIGSIGYAVRVSEWNKGYGTQILRRGLEIAKEHGMEKVLLNINEKNAASVHVCEKLGGKLWDTIERYNEAEGDHLVRRYWIMLQPKKEYNESTQGALYGIQKSH